MTRGALRVAVLALVAVGCRTANTSSQTLTSAQEAALADTIGRLTRATIDSWAVATCENPEPALKFFDYSAPGLVYGDGSTIDLYAGNAWPDAIRQGQCEQSDERGGVDSLLVRVLSRDVATVSHIYHTSVKDKSGVPRSWQGAALRVWVRTADGWKVRVGMSTHIPTDSAP